MKINKISLLIGARPNYMKVFPLWKELFKNYSDITVSLIHTGQHYDEKMSEVFFQELKMPPPDIFLGIGSGSHGVQTARALTRIEKALMDNTPDLFVVVGDVNSTLAGALAASKLQIPCAHIEAGLRSFDRNMPEEINRILVDPLCDLLFTHSHDADENLKKEGIPHNHIFCVGNVMIDSLLAMLPKKKSPPPELLDKGKYILVTLHRPSNVDCAERLQTILHSLVTLSQCYPIIFPMHPRTRKNIEKDYNRLITSSNIQFIDPCSYLEFLGLLSHAALIVTDSGGIQEESTFLGIPCITLRPNTERPITISQGTNRLCNPQKESLKTAVFSAIENPPKHPPKIPLWDGNAAARIMQTITSL